MPDPNQNQSGSDTTKSQPEGQIASYGTDPDKLSVFFGPGEVAVSGDPAKDGDGKTAETPKAPEAGDPSKGTTPGDGSAKDGSGQEPPKRYANKYETPEALEAGYNSLFTHNRTIEAENKAMRAREAELTAQLKKIQSGATQPGPTPDAASQKVTAEVEAAKKRLEEFLGPDGVKDLELVYGKPVNQPVDDDLRREIDNLKFEGIKRDFYEMRPEAKEPKVVEAVDKLTAEMIEKMADPTYMLGLLTDAAIGRMLPDLIDAGVKSKLTRMSEDDKKRLLAANIVVDTPASGGGGPGASEGDPKRKEQRDVFFADQPHMMR